MYSQGYFQDPRASQHHGQNHASRQMGGDPWGPQEMEDPGNPFRGLQWDSQQGGDWQEERQERQRFGSFMDEDQYGGADLAARNSRFSQLVHQVEEMNNHMNQVHRQYGHQMGGAAAKRGETLAIYLDMSTKIRKMYADQVAKSGKKSDDKLRPALAMKMAKLGLDDARKSLRKDAKNTSPEVVKEALQMVSRRLDHYMKMGEQEMAATKQKKEAAKRKKEAKARR